MAVRTPIEYTEGLLFIGKTSEHVIDGPIILYVRVLHPHKLGGETRPGIKQSWKFRKAGENGY